MATTEILVYGPQNCSDMTRRGLILDIDNTLYSWVDAFLPGFRAIVQILSKELRVSEDEIIEDFRVVYQIHGTVEYPHAMEELPVWTRVQVSPDEQSRILSRAHKVFSMTHRRNLKLFPNVMQVLSWAAREGIIVVGLSDALERWIIYRLRSLGVEKYFQGLYTWHNEPWFDERKALRSSIKKRMRLTSSELKPNQEIIAKVLQDFSLDKEDTFLVGDSISKDIAAAKNSGIKDVWARYRVMKGRLYTTQRARS